MLLGIIPSKKVTYEVYGTINDPSPKEGKLYYDPDTQKLFYYSENEKRSNPNTGYFPIWDGNQIYISKFSKIKYFDKDVMKMDIASMSNSITQGVAERVMYDQRKSDNGSLLKPSITDHDNLYTQCIKGAICGMDLSMVDLVDKAAPTLTQLQVENFYSTLNRITFMRYEKWNVWIDVLLKIKYDILVYHDGKMCIKYSYPSNTFDTGIVKYKNIIKTNYDPFKKIVKILMIMFNINKSVLKEGVSDDYTINNLLTTINGDKVLSAQLFSRFMRMANMSYTIQMYDKEKLIFEFKE